MCEFSVSVSLVSLMVRRRLGSARVVNTDTPLQGDVEERIMLTRMICLYIYMYRLGSARGRG